MVLLSILSFSHISVFSYFVVIVYWELHLAMFRRWLLQVLHSVIIPSGV